MLNKALENITINSVTSRDDKSENKKDVEKESNLTLNVKKSEELLTENLLTQNIDEWKEVTTKKRQKKGLSLGGNSN